MKTKLGVLIFLFLTGLVLGALQPALVYGGELGGGNFWDPFVNVSLFTGNPIPAKQIRSFATKLYGPLSLSGQTNFTFCDNGQYQLTLFYTVTLSSDDRDDRDDRIGHQLYTSFTPGLCFGDITGEGVAIMGFLKTVVLQIFPHARDAYVKSVSNPWYEPDGWAFAADITIMVKQ